MFDVRKLIMNLESIKLFMMFHYKYEIMRIVSVKNKIRSINFNLKILVTESFRDFCKSEILTGENLYDAGSIHGFQVCFFKKIKLII